MYKDTGKTMISFYSLNLYFSLLTLKVPIGVSKVIQVLKNQ